MATSRPSESDSLNQVQMALGRVLRSLVFRGDPNSPFVEMPISQLKCLHIIAENEGQKMMELAHRMETKLPALSQIVERLVRRGMVARAADPSDRRVVRLVLTQNARALIDEAEAHRKARLAATVRPLSAQDQQCVIAGLSRLAESAERVEAAEKAAAPPFSPDPDAVAEIVARRNATLGTESIGRVSPSLPSGRP